jgi:hypothetical protein
MADVGILGPDAVRGDVHGVETLARFLAAATRDVTAIQSKLLSSSGASWEGAAAQAFRNTLKSLPEDLAKAARSYEMAASAMSTYRSRFAPARDEAVRLAAALERAEQRLAAAQRSSRAADAARRSAANAHRAASDPASKHSSERALDHAGRAANDAHRELSAASGEIARIRQLAHANRASLDAIARAVGEQLHDASRAGIRNRDHHFYDGIVDAAEGVASWTAGAVKDVGHALGQTLSDAWNIRANFMAFLHDPSWENFDKLVSSVQAVLTVVAIVLAVAAAIFTGGTSLAFIGAAMAWTKAASAGVAAAKFGVDLGRYSTGDRAITPGTLFGDAVSLGFSAHGANKAFQPGTLKVAGKAAAVDKIYAPSEINDMTQKTRTDLIRMKLVGGPWKVYGVSLGKLDTVRPMMLAKVADHSVLGRADFASRVLLHEAGGQVIKKTVGVGQKAVLGQAGDLIAPHLESARDAGAAALDATRRTLVNGPLTTLQWRLPVPSLAF